MPLQASRALTRIVALAEEPRQCCDSEPCPTGYTVRYRHGHAMPRLPKQLAPRDRLARYRGTPCAAAVSARSAVIGSRRMSGWRPCTARVAVRRIPGSCRRVSWRKACAGSASVRSVANRFLTSERVDPRGLCGGQAGRPARGVQSRQAAGENPHCLHQEAGPANGHQQADRGGRAADSGAGPKRRSPARSSATG